MADSVSIWIQWNHLETPIEATDEVALILKEIMEEAGKVLLKIVPVEAEVVVASSWVKIFPS